MIFFISCGSEKENIQSSKKRISIKKSSSKEEKIEEFNKSVFCLSVINQFTPKEKRRAIGTTFLVANNLFATAFHVKNDLELAGNQSSTFKSQIIAWKKFDDGD